MGWKRVRRTILVATIALVLAGAAIAAGGLLVANYAVDNQTVTVRITNSDFTSHIGIVTVRATIAGSAVTSVAPVTVMAGESVTVFLRFPGPVQAVATVCVNELSATTESADPF